jgi:hypothetical protein
MRKKKPPNNDLEVEVDATTKRKKKKNLKK